METQELTMSYESLVAAGREARTQADNMQWVEGDLALQVEALPAGERPRDPETGEFIKDEVRALKRYAEDVDIPYSTVQAYRYTASRWPPSARADGVSWKVHEVLAAQEDRFAVIRSGMTVREARKFVRDRTKGNSGKPGWHELIGRVGDALKAAEKHMDVFEAAVGDESYGSALAEKALRYHDWAFLLARRLGEFAGDMTQEDSNHG